MIGAPKRKRVAARMGVAGTMEAMRAMNAGYKYPSVRGLVNNLRRTRITMTLPLILVSSFPGPGFFFSPGFLFTTVAVPPPVGGRHIAAYTICRAPSNSNVFVSAGTGSATMDGNWYV